jgi:phytoene synthase
MTPQDIMTHHARSFAPAARLLPRHDRQRVARLYAVCRTIDDIADEIGGDVGRTQLQALCDDLKSFDPHSDLASEAIDLFKGQPLGLAALVTLVETAAADTDATCIADSAALDIYCMGVAGTVGVMICSLFDIDPAFYQKAADLGKAMQLTNICRDVAEDAGIGRRYLPATMCPYSPEDIAMGNPEAIAAAEASMAVLLDRSDDLYRSGRSALKELPLRLRLAVASAAAMYEGIGTQLRRRNYQPLAGRAYVRKHRKAGLAIHAIIGEIFWNREGGSGHAGV